MHHSRLCAVLIDCKTADVDEAAHFWAAALGRPVDLARASRRMPTAGIRPRVGLRRGKSRRRSAAAAGNEWSQLSEDPTQRLPLRVLG